MVVVASDKKSLDIGHRIAKKLLVISGRIAHSNDLISYVYNFMKIRGTSQIEIETIVNKPILFLRY
jgi:hypothetical protein